MRNFLILIALRVPQYVRRRFVAEVGSTAFVGSITQVLGTEPAVSPDRAGRGAWSAGLDGVGAGLDGVGAGLDGVGAGLDGVGGSLASEQLAGHNRICGVSGLLAIAGVG